MKNSKGISLIALIITIIVIIILAAIVIGGVFNTPNDAKFANFCQQYDELQTQIQLKYYSLYQNSLSFNHFQIFFAFSPLNGDLPQADGMGVLSAFQFWHQKYP